MHLRDVLVIQHITKNLLSFYYEDHLGAISKLTNDNHVDVVFSHPYFHIHDRTTKQVLVKGRCQQGLYVLHNSPQEFFATSGSNNNKASFELWHTR